MKKGIGMIQSYRRIGLVLVLSVGMLVVESLPSAQAGLMLRLQSGSDTKTVEDGGAGDINSVTGAVTFMGSVGNFFLNVTTGLSKPVIGDKDYIASLDLNSVNVSGALPGSLTLMLTDTDFDLLPPSIGSAITLIGGVTPGFVTFETFLDPDNKEFGEMGSPISLTGAQAPLGGGAIDKEVSTTVPLPDTGPFSLTSIVTLTHPTGGMYSSFNLEVSVATPEPGTLLLLGTGLLGFAGYTWRRRMMQKV